MIIRYAKIKTNNGNEFLIESDAKVGDIISTQWGSFPVIKIIIQNINPKETEPFGC
jgi:hypothetical protein